MVHFGYFGYFKLYDIFQTLSNLQRYNKNNPNMTILWPKYGPKHIYGTCLVLCTISVKILIKPKVVKTNSKKQPLYDSNMALTWSLQLILPEP